ESRLQAVEATAPGSPSCPGHARACPRGDGRTLRRDRRQRPTLRTPAAAQGVAGAPGLDGSGDLLRDAELVELAPLRRADVPEADMDAGEPGRRLVLGAPHLPGVRPGAALPLHPE